MKRRPNFFIAGFPRSGSTTMWHYLALHPDIYVNNKRKEFNYFNRDYVGPMSFDNYLKYFSKAKNQKIIADGSNGYVFSKSAPKEIRKVCEKVKIVMLIRNPVDFMYSVYGSMHYEGVEKLPFEKAYYLSDKRQNDFPLIRYKWIANYALHLKPWLEEYGNDILFIISEEFRKSPISSMQEVFRHIGVDASIPITKLENINTNPIVKSKFVDKILKNHFIRKNAKLILPTRVREVGMIIKKMNTGRKPRKKLDNEFRQKIYREFIPVINDTSSLIGRNLKEVWKN